MLMKILELSSTRANTQMPQKLYRAAVRAYFKIFKENVSVTKLTEVRLTRFIIQTQNQVSWCSKYVQKNFRNSTNKAGSSGKPAQHARSQAFNCRGNINNQMRSRPETSHPQTYYSLHTTKFLKNAFQISRAFTWNGFSLKLCQVANIQKPK